MRHALLHAVNVFYYYWLIKKLILPIDRQTEPGGKSKQREREKEGGVWKMPAAVGESG